MPLALGSEEPQEQSNGIPEAISTSRKPGRPPGVNLEPYKDLIVKLFTEENTPIVDITRKLNLELGLDVSERKVSRTLATWNVRKRIRGPISPALQDRLTYHYNLNLNDDQIAQALISEGFEIKRTHMGRLRQKLGMRRRSRYSEFRENSEGSAAVTNRTPKPSSTFASKPKNTTPKMAQNAGLITQVTAFVEKYMSAYDGSHDFNHIRRVVGLAHRIYKDLNEERMDEPELDLQVVTLAALLHDVGDKKYLLPGQDQNTLVLSTLLGFGAEEKLAVKVQRIVLGVSYSSEIQDLAAVEGLIEKYPELAVVQDADRLDAIGAIGIGRTFTFGGAKGARDMGETIQHFEDKLEKLGGMMKTAPGKRLAEERTKRLTTFKDWWQEEQVTLKMNSMAPELLKHILTCLPMSSLRSCRFVNRAFSMLAFSLLFSDIRNWLDSSKSLQLLVSIAHDPFNRPTVIWSPWATVYDVHVEVVWLQIVWRILKGGDLSYEGELTAENFAGLSGMFEMTEGRLSTAQFRYLIFKSYMKKPVLKVEGRTHITDILTNPKPVAP
ncbi:hypothetical protein SBOR_1140 [Sclerotinia borealis F-4128]|uniref:HD/PDEase domain-containing protein n=1 Tax=Sclerotinia borealis (strain F-4128) TaxID=1432307 RepID=W9CQX6_SCLBF|nr:hypothetical protein SBOR_1140 [Sclerotinia borealis F-4128]